MTDREARIAAFAAAAGWGGARVAPLAGDASNRRYLRLRGADGATSVMMDAPPDRGEDVRPFLAIGRHLAGLGLSAPGVLAADPDAGLLLLEDLGDRLFAREIAQHPAAEPALYAAAIDLLAELQRHPAPPGLACYDPALMGDLAGLALDWYASTLAPAAQARDDLAAEVAALCAALAPPEDLLVLRDFHAENLIWLPGRRGSARVGLLDFQDAMRGPAGYDLVSLLQDARRDVPAALARAMADRFAAATGRDAAGVAAACAVLGAQRNLRILGVFARLCLRDGKPGYLRLIPRVWGHLQHDLAHPALTGLARRLAPLLPPPDVALLQDLARRCAPTPPR